jgi:hypothetical protein
LKLGFSSTETDGSPFSVKSAAWALDMNELVGFFNMNGVVGLNRLLRVKLGG